MNFVKKRRHVRWLLPVTSNIQEDTIDAEVDMGDCAVLGMSFGESVVLESWLIYTN